MRFLKAASFTALLFLLFANFRFGPVFAANQYYAEIFYSEACSDCVPYLEKILEPTLGEKGIEVETKDYINKPQFRLQLSERISQDGIPQEMVGHMMTFIRTKNSQNERAVWVLAGHVPQGIIRELIWGPLPGAKIRPLVIWQDEMHGSVKNYRVWSKGGVIRNYSIETPLAEALKKQGELGFGESQKSLLPAVLVAGFLDGLNPCAFAILLFLIAFIFMLKKSRLSVLKYGVFYIGAIYITYLLIGLGLWKSILIIGVPHLMAKVGAALVIILGMVNILNFLFPKFPISLRISMPGRQKILDLMHKGTLPTTVLLGIFVGLCTFPCSGGIYVAIVTLLAAKTTFTLGFLYLLIYNLMFVLPLILILVLAGNRMTVEKMNNLEEQNERRMRLIYGLLMVAIGIVILVYFV